MATIGVLRKVGGGCLEEKKNGRNSARVCQDLGPGHRRYLIVESELKTALRIKEKTREIARYVEEGDRQGTMRSILSLAMLYTYCNRIESNQTLHSFQKTTFDKFWSALEVWRCEPRKAEKSPSEYAQDIGTFLTSTGIDLSCIPGGRSKFDLRQETTSAMAISFREYIPNTFPSRVRRHVKYLLANEINDVLALEKDRRPLVSAVLAHIYNLDSLDTLQSIFNANGAHLTTAIEEFILESRTAIRTMINAATCKDGKVPGLLSALHACGHLALPYLRKVVIGC